ncbi:MAG: glycosyltransferase, partial [Chloroflexota bacterium]|nr:glycosyltransferase [Chloroflexota bacterium]
MSEVLSASVVPASDARGAPVPRKARLWGGAARICLYTPSADPSGLGAHLLDLAAEYVGCAEVSVMCRATEGGQGVLDRAAALGARTLPLPRPRDPSFAEVVTRFLQEHPVDLFHCHVGIGWENWDGVRAARRAGVPAVVQTQHLPFLLSSPGKRAGFLRAIEPVDRLLAVSEGLRGTYERIGVPSGRFATVPNG